MHSFRCLSLGLLVGLALNPWHSAGLAAEPTKPTGDQPASVITPKLEGCTLEWGDLSQKPLCPPSVDPLSISAGGLRVTVAAGDVRASRGGAIAPVWEAKAPVGSRLAWLGADDKFGYLLAFRVNEDHRKDRPQEPAKVRRLELASGRWMDDLTLPGPPDQKRVETIADVLVADGRVTVFVNVKAAKGEDSKMAGYRVVCFKAGEAKPLWSKEFSSAGPLPRPDAFLLAAGALDKLDPRIRTLNALGRDILVCAGPVEDLVCLSGDTGEQRWRKPRVWEYERGFIGPSIWQHTMGGGGQELSGGKDDKQGSAPGRRNVIVGGPVVVNPKGAGRPHFFLAVAKGPEHYAEYLSECVVYEFLADGRPLGMVSLPRMVRGGQAMADGGGLVWACAGGGFVRLSLADDRENRFGMMARGTDYLCDVEWYRAPRPARVGAWLTADPAGDSVAFGSGWAVWARSGGYVPAPDSKEYRFPLALVDLSTGAVRDLELRVPFVGRVSEPEGSFRRTTDSAGKDQWHAYGAHLLGVTGLAADGDKLRVTLGMSNWARTVVFEIPGPKSK